MVIEEADGSEDAKASGGVSKLLVWLVVAVLAIGGGAATPIVIAQLGPGSGQGQPEEKPVAIPDPEEEVDFIEFDEITVNLDEARFSRYLRFNFSLQVAQSQKANIESKVEAKNPILKNWLQTTVSEKSTEDLRGKHGRNRLRREMLDYFNEVLFEDGIERIQDVLFGEFQVQ